tara:strand:+ start:265 stop:927 length:663 start_codon:yes stop_codon:yes gene_type:complete
LNTPRIVIIIASSLDGRIAFPQGGESHLGSTKDRKILDEYLSTVDATIFGLGTLKAHQSTYLVKNHYENGEIKISKNQPISMIACNSMKFNKDWKYFKQPIKRWLISSNKTDEKEKIDFDKEINYKNSWSETLLSIKQAGINRIALLGGAKLINSFVKENLVDEIKLTITPRIIGGQFTWIPTEKTNQIFNFKQFWNIKSIQELDKNEIHIHYTRKINAN